MKIELVSKQIHRFGGKLRKKGEHFEATQREAKALIAMGRAMAVLPPPPNTPTQVVPKPTQANPPESPPEIAEGERIKRAYKRKDIQAESPIENHEPVAVAPVAQSLVDEVAKVKDSFRASYTLTRPKASTKE